jgi:hypothetical protein
MSNLVVIMWLILSAAIIITSVDLNSKNRLSRSVISPIELKILAGVWFLFLVILKIPIALLALYSFKEGGNRLWLAIIVYVTLETVVFFILLKSKYSKLIGK